MELDGLRTIVMLPPGVTLKFSHHIYEPKYICDRNWVKIPSLFYETWCSQGFRDAKAHSLRLTHGRTHPKTVCPRHEGFCWRRHLKQPKFVVFLDLYSRRARVWGPHGERELITGIWGQSRVHGQSPWSGVKLSCICTT